MTLAQKISAQIENLPESYQAEVLDFVEFLEHKAKKQPAANDDERTEWSRFALFHAMQGLEEDEDWLETENRALGGQRPLELLDTDTGTREVDDIFGRIEHGIFS